MFNLASVVIIVGIVFARLYYCLVNHAYYAENLNEILNIRQGGLSIHGGILGGFISGVIYCKYLRLPILKMADIVAYGLILAQAIGRWGNFMNQEAHGVATTLGFLKSLHLPKFIINQMYIDGTYYQPTFLYESLWDISGFVVLIILRRQKKLLKSGEVVLSYIIWYSFGRFFIEGMRTDSLMLGSLRVSQWLSLILFISAIAAIFYRRYNDPLLKWYTE